MSRRDPPDVAILSARIMRAWPSLSPFSCASLAAELCSIERAQRRHAERACSGSDGGYVKRGRAITGYGVHETTVATHDPEAEQRAARRIVSALTRWKSEVSHRVIPDGVDASDGTPAREAMIRVASDLSTRIELHDDPRGAVLLLRLPGEPEAVTV